VGTAMKLKPEHIEDQEEFRKGLREPEYTYDHALELWDFGFNIVPALPGTKRPLGMWKEFQERRVTRNDLRRWYIDTQGLGIGMVTGAVSGISVIDCDTREDAVWWWQNFARTPLMSKTGGGGVHFFYRYAPSGNRAGVLDRKIDVRNDGGFVVLPYTQHSETGRMYEWVEWPVDMDNVPVFDPEWVGESAPLVSEPAGHISHARSYISKIVAVSGEGGHNSTFRAACKLRDSGLSEAEALAEMIEWNRTNAQPEWALRELAHKVRDAFRATSEGLQRQEKWIQEQMGQACCEGGRCK